MRATVAIASISLLTSCTEPAHTQAPLFQPAPFSPVTVGKGSGTVVLADVNRDNHLDLVTQHLLSESVNVMLGDGNGGFVTAAGSPMKPGYQPGTIAVGDVNNDRVPDLVIAHKDSSSEYIDIFLGDGRGAFGRSLGSLRASAAMEFYKPVLRLVDLNTDGNVDIVTANGRRPTIEVLLGEGDGSFGAAKALSVGPTRGMSSFAIGDVDGDGNVDLVAATSAGEDLGKLGPGRVVTKRGDGMGNFIDASGATDAAPSGTIIEALLDINGDGQLDAVISHADRNTLGVLVNKGTGAFAASPVAPLQLKSQTYRVVVADVNGDSKADLLAATVQSRATPFDSQVTVFLAADTGFVQAPGSPFPAGNGAYNLAVGDVNGDGRLDVVSSSFEGNALTVLLGTGGGTAKRR